ncbi:hypothetical protein CS0771_13150 [Catellatospora sp. IY07-71]|uniref:DUF2786 domain-containing protein n=1 Tax=Catellatospora sp. IY07-71 TaxID=2728827 RepID=UPI001BB2EFA7|nr:DUF2786 domain-containing protein [Catellatospora sp. IY07-71]BCJ71771.1 hypothetical protein CS0771_13150 [Catellatospora sp. IY07-71]
MTATTPSTDGAATHRRYADRMFAEVTGALHRRDHRAFRKACDDVYASTLDSGAVGAAALHATGLAVQHAWDLNWQPAELDHALRRFAAKVKAPAAVTAWMIRLLSDASAGRMRAHAPETVTGRWHSQLEVLEAAVWWGADEEHLAAFGQRHGLDRLKVLGGAFELMRWIHHELPRLEKAGHAPGTPIPPRRSASRATQAADQRMLDRIRALLAKAESTGFPEEAEAFTAKAQQLMARHSIDHALLDATAGGGDGPDTRRIVIANPYEGPKALLLQVVARANNCRAVNFKEYGLSTMVGFEPDLDAVELLYTSLLVQAVRAMTAANARPDRYGRNDVRSFRQAFLSAYADRIGERLAEAAEEGHAEAAAGTDLVPVLAARNEAVSTAFDELFPNRVTGAARIGNLAGWASGRAAADRADLAARAPLPRT